MTALPVADYFKDPSRLNSQAKAAQDDILAVIRELLGGEAESTLTILTGSITPTRATHSVDTEGGAGTDDLTNIDYTNHPAGRILLIRTTNTARDITVKHAAGGVGEIILSDGSDFTMTDITQYLLLQRRGTQWVEIIRWYATDVAAWQTFFGLGDCATQDADAFSLQLTMDGVPINENLATNIASATNIDIGPVDGNFIQITGSTTIEALGSASAGARRVLRFVGNPSPLLKDSVNVILPNDEDIQTETFDVATFRSLGVNAWLCTGYLRFTGEPLKSKGKMVLLETEFVPPAVSSVEFTIGFDDSTYAQHIIIGDGIRPVGGALFFAEMRVGGVWQTGASDYDTAIEQLNVASGGTRSYTGAAAAAFTLTNGLVSANASTGAELEVKIGNAAFTSGPTQVSGRVSGEDSGLISRVWEHWGKLEQAAAIDGYRVSFSGQNIANGRFYHYGIVGE